MKVIWLCVFLFTTSIEISETRVCISSHNERELLSVKLPTVRCHSDYQACYTRWAVVNGTDKVTEQGCLNVGSSSICSETDCVEKTNGNAGRNFCCCYRDLCNQNYTRALSKGQQIPRKGKLLTFDSSAKEKSFDNVVTQRTVCSYHDSNRMLGNSTDDYEAEPLPGTLLSSNTVLCPGNDYCFSVWQVVEKGNDSETVVIKQGCWQKMDECSADGQCIANGRSTKAKYCCCYGNMCNVNISDADGSSPLSSENPSHGAKLLSEAYSQYKEKTIIISLVSVVSAALIIMGVYLLYRLCLVSKKTSTDSLHLVEAPPPRGIDLEGLEVEKQICRGRNSNVWQGTLGNIDVAIKMFASNHKQLYLNEKSIYSLPFMEHENLLKFYGSEERLTMEGYKQYWMVLSYCPMGNLQCYLKNNLIDWSTFCKMALTTIRGLSHLHTEIKKGDQFKPTVAHRDINTRNILVTPDNSCIVGDLGFAIATVGSKLMKNGHYESAEQASLQDVGTLRYMAPELLDGAANLRESETSLKQIDIYAFGLVLWELSSRCTCLYNGVPVPDYSLPYQKEAGIHPTFEEMQILVSRNKVRPKFPEVWKDYNQAVRALKDTMEDCWDHDAEARLTSMCVEERIMDMMILWTQDSKHKATTPLLNTTSNLFNNPVDDDIEPVTEPVMSRHEMSDSSTAQFIVNSPPNTNVSFDVTESYPHRGMSVSNSTVETFIPPSTPSEGETFQKNYRMMVEKNSRVLQPHQGRNPTVERNTHKKSDEEIAVSGNTLLYGNEILDNNMVSLNDTLMDNVNENLDTSLVQSDFLNINTRHTNAPIPYLQNQVHRTDSGTRPKNANLKNACNVSANNTETKNKFLTKLFGPKGYLPIGLFHLGSKSSGKSSNSGNVQSQNKDNGVPLHERRTAEQSGGVLSANITNQIHKPSNPSLSEQMVPKDFMVSIHNGKPVSRPMNINLLHENEMSEESSDEIQLPSLNDELGIAHLELSQLPQQFRLIIKDKDHVEQYSKSTSDLYPFDANKDIEDSGNLKRSRPDSLKLKGHNYTVSSSQTYPQNNTRDKKIKRRVKTPLNLMKHGRFSLYDDRLMTQYKDFGGQETQCVYKHSGDSLCSKQSSSSSLYEIKKCCDGNANSVSLADRNC